MAKLSESDIDARLRETPWEREGETIVREWGFADFAQALAFVDRVGEAAEQAGHHPDILLHGWNRVRLTLCTHSEGGLTQADFDLARRIEQIA